MRQIGLLSRRLEAWRLQKVLPYLERPLLDVGCGEAIACGAQSDGYVGVDLVRSRLLGAIHRGASDVLWSSATSLPARSECFRTVLMMAVIEHLTDPAHCLREVVRVLMPGGRLVVTTPTPLGDRLHHVLARIGLTSAHAAQDHVSVFAASELRAALDRVGLRVQEYTLFQLGANQLCVGIKTPR